MMNKRVGKPSHLLISSPCCFHPAKLFLVLSSLIPEGKNSPASLHLLDIHKENVAEQQAGVPRKTAPHKAGAGQRFGFRKQQLCSGSVPTSLTHSYTHTISRNGKLNSPGLGITGIVQN